MLRVIAPAALVAALLIMSAPVPAQDATGVVITQFATRGPGGPNDDYIELFNAGRTTVSLRGWSIRSCFGSTTATLIDQGTIEAELVVPPRRYLLLGGSAYSRGTRPDAFIGQVPDFLTTAFNGRGGIQLLDATGAVRDGIGAPASAAQPAGSHCREGNGRATVNTGAADVAYFRRLVGGQPQDSDDNARDFPGAATTPRPRNLASPAAAEAVARPTGTLSASAADIEEAGGTATITATLSAAFTDAVTVTLRFTEFALRDTDYSASATRITIDPGSRSGSISLRGLDDMLFEGDETLIVQIETVDNATVGSTDRLAITVRDDDTAAVLDTPRIFSIQGAAHRSPLVGRTVSNVPGIVTAIAADGFYFQDPDGDGNPATADALFVRSAGSIGLAIGSRVAVSGVVREARPEGLGGLNNLSVTEIAATRVGASSFPFAAGSVTPTVIGISGRIPPAEIIDNDSAGNLERSETTQFDPAEDGLDFLESLEGMLVTVGNARVIGPTDAGGRFWVVGDNGSMASGGTARGGLSVVERSRGAVDLNPERLRIDGSLPGITAPPADVGDSISLLRGVVDYTAGSYAIRLTATPAVTRNALPPDRTRLAAEADRLTVASYDLGALGPAENARRAAIARQIVTALGAPDLLLLGGIGDDSGPGDDGIVVAEATITGLLNAITAAGGPAYVAVQIDPADNADGDAAGRNTRMVLLHNPQRVVATDGAFGAGITGSPVALLSGPQIGPLTLNLSPALLRPEIPALAGIGKPLVASYRVNGRSLLVVGSQFSPADGDDSPFGLNQPPQSASDARRRLQAATIHRFVRSALALEPLQRVVVLGAFNDDDFRAPLRVLRNGPLGSGDTDGSEPALINLGTQRVTDAAERYTQIVDGNGRATDHILISAPLDVAGTALQYVHFNSEYASRSADRDAVLASIPLGANQPPVVRVSADPTVADEGTGIDLFGDTSRDIDGSIRGFRWTQVDGPDAGGIASPLSANASIVAPALDATAVLRFRLTTTDNDGGSSSADVAITVNARNGDFIPDPVQFTSVSGVEPGSEQTSNEVLVSGINQFANLSVRNGSYNVNGGAFVTEPTQVFGGERIRLRTRASAQFSTAVVATLDLSGSTADFTVRTRDGNTVPSPFGFAETRNADPGTTVTSESAVITGLEAPAPISVSGGRYSINGGPFTAAAGRIANLDAVRVQQTASTSFATTTVATLTIGGVAGRYPVTTRAADTTPDAFAFAAITDAAPGATATSEAVTITGLEAAAPISVGGGRYAINGGAFTDAIIGTVNNGDRVQVQLVAATQPSETRVATLTIGGVAADFRVTTAAARDTTPDAFSFPTVTGAPLNTPTASAPVAVSGINAPAPVSVRDGLYSVNGAAFTANAGRVNDGDTVRVQRTSAATARTRTVATLVIGGVSGEFAVLTGDADSNPRGFSFAPVEGVEPGSRQISEPITVTGVDGNAPISIVGGQYAVDEGPFTASAGTVRNGARVRVRVVAATSFATPASATISIGAERAAFTVTTRAGDAEPDPFAFPAVDNAEPGALTTSVAIAVGGIEVPVSITVRDGLYAINDGAFTGDAGLVVSGDRVRVQTTAAATLGTARSARLAIGNADAAFTVTTRGADTMPNGFGFAPVTDVEPGAVVRSGSIVVAGIEAASPIGIVNGQYAINGGAFTAAPGSVVNGDRVRVRQQAASSFTTTTVATLTIGGVAGEFSATTRAPDLVPDALAFAPVMGADPGTAVVSAAQTISGLEAEAPITVEGGRYALNDGAFTAVPGRVVNGDRVRVERLAASGFGDSATATLTIGDVQAAFAVTTRAADIAPDPFGFTARDGTALLTEQISEPVVVSGIEAAVPIAVDNGAYAINDGPFVTPLGIVQPGDRVRLRHVSANRPGTATITTLTIADRSAEFRTTTAAATVDPGPAPNPGPTPAGGGTIHPLWLAALLALRRFRRRAR